MKVGIREGGGASQHKKVGAYLCDSDVCSSCHARVKVAGGVSFLIIATTLADDNHVKWNIPENEVSLCVGFPGLD